MNAVAEYAVIRQHLIDPEICIRCNTCEATCPIGAITHDDRNYVVRADVCNSCMACISPCPTGAIDNWRDMPRAKAYPIDEQLLWDELPAELSAEQLAAEGAVAVQEPDVVQEAVAVTETAAVDAPFDSAAWGATVPPWSAAHAYSKLYGPKQPTTATVVGNFNCTEAGFASETHHIVLDFGAMPFPVLEVQGGQLVEKEVPMLNALNEVLRDDFIKDSVAGVERWNKVIAKAGIPTRLQVPHKAFHRNIGALAGINMSPDGRVVNDAEWNAKTDEWLPTAEDRAFVASLMGRVVEPGKFAGWIAPPVMGVNRQPIDFEYVRFG